MGSWKEWLFETVATELTLTGLDDMDLGKLAGAGDQREDQIRQRFPDKQSLMLALVDEISREHQDFVLQECAKFTDPGKHLECFLAASLDFLGPNQVLAHVIVLALLGNNPAVKERVHQEYGRLFARMLDAMESEGIVPDQSPLLVSDLTTTLLSVIFLGGCPWLQMEYLSFVHPDRVAASTLEALRKRYSAGMHESLLP